MVVPAMEFLGLAIEELTGIKVTFKHMFSVENDKRKQAWIKAHFPDLPYLFEDVTDFAGGRAAFRFACRVHAQLCTIVSAYVHTYVRTYVRNCYSGDARS